MAHIWQYNGTTWVRQPLARRYAGLRADAATPAQPSHTLPESGAQAVLGHCESRDQTPHWVLMAKESASVRVNGHPLPAGIAVLHDRDEILIGGRARVYFSTEELAKVEPFPGGEGSVYCARCRQPIQPGTPAVRCPTCGHWCEQTEAKPCWTYGPSCPLCEQPTAFDTGLRWTPEEL